MIFAASTKQKARLKIEAGSLIPLLRGVSVGFTEVEGSVTRMAISAFHFDKTLPKWKGFLLPPISMVLAKGLLLKGFNLFQLNWNRIGICANKQIKAMSAAVDLLKIKSDLALKNNMHTITENEVLLLLRNELPQIEEEIKSAHNQASIYSVINCFADVTKHMAKVGDLKEVKHCFNIAEKLWLAGNGTVKNAIENGYLFSLSSVLDLNTKIKDLLNAPLRKEYNRQVCSHGI